MAWARQGAPAGAVVVADYQASPRGRAGIEWRVTPGDDLGFSVVLQPRLPIDREGWLYTVALCALLDVCGERASVVWPDELYVAGRRAAAVGVQTDPTPGRIRWATVTVLLMGVEGPRGDLLARAVARLEAWLQAPSSEVLDTYTARCATLGQRVRARLIPLGPGGVAIEGEAVACLKDGALLLATDDGRRVAIRPQALGLLERVNAPSTEPA